MIDVALAATKWTCILCRVTTEIGLILLVSKSVLKVNQFNAKVQGMCHKQKDVTIGKVE